MRKSIVNIFAALIVIAYVPYAYSDSITDGTYNFTVTFGSPAPSGSFVWDNTTNTWISWTVNWDGAVYDFTGVADYAYVLGDVPTNGTWCAAAPFRTNLVGCVATQFKFENAALSDLWYTQNISGSFTDTSAGASGTYTLTENTVPEPGSLSLLGGGLLGLGFTAWRRKQGTLPFV